MLKNKLRDGQIYASKSIDLVETNSVKTIDIDRDDFNSYEYNRQFALENNIDLTSPFLNLYSKHEQVEVARKMIEKFDLLELEKRRLWIRGMCGVNCRDCRLCACRYDIS